MEIQYIAHPVKLSHPTNPPTSEGIQDNIRKIESIIEELHTSEVYPIAPYLQGLNYLDDFDPEERDMGIASNKEYFERKFMDKMRVCGDPRIVDISVGIKAEIGLCHEYDIPVVTHTPELEPVVRKIEDELQ